MSVAFLLPGMQGCVRHNFLPGNTGSHIAWLWGTIPITIMNDAPGIVRCATHTSIRVTLLGIWLSEYNISEVKSAEFRSIILKGQTSKRNVKNLRIQKGGQH